MQKYALEKNKKMHKSEKCANLIKSCKISKCPINPVHNRVLGKFGFDIAENEPSKVVLTMLIVCFSVLIPCPVNQAVRRNWSLATTNA